jgi:uncharacterized protein HemX
MTFIIKNWKLILAAVLAAACITAGWTAAWKIRGVEVGEQKAQVVQLNSDLDEAKKANKENMNTIASLQEEQKRSDTLCSARLKKRDRLTARIREIDAITTSKGKSNEKGLTADPLLDRLNGMFGVPGGR